MDLKNRLKELKPHDLNCNVFDVYSYNGLSMQELLCQFFTKINECVDTTNNSSDIIEWLVNEGLDEKIARQLFTLVTDGTVEQLINTNIFEKLNKDVVNVSLQLDQKADEGEIIQYINNEIAKVQLESSNLDIADFTTSYDTTKLGGYITTKSDVLEGGYDSSFEIKENELRGRTNKFFLKKGDFITISNDSYLFRPIIVRRYIDEYGLEKNNVHEVLKDKSVWLKGKFIAEETGIYAVVLKKSGDLTVNTSEVTVVVNNREGVSSPYDLKCVCDRLHNTWFNPQHEKQLLFSEPLDTVIIDEFEGNTISCNHAYSFSGTKTLLFLKDNEIITGYTHSEINGIKHYKIPIECNKIIVMFNRNDDIKLEITNQNYSSEFDKVNIKPKFFVSKTEKEKMSHGGELIVDNGVGYVAYLCSETSTVEQPGDNSIMCRLSVFDICSNEKEVYDVAKANSTIDGIKIDNSAVYEPNIVDDGNNINYMLMAKINGVNTYFNYKFNKKEKVFSKFNIMKLVYDSSVYDFNSNNVKTILDDLTGKSTNCHHMVFTGRIQEYNGLYYGVLCGTVGSVFDGLLLTSKDLITWEVKKSLDDLGLNYVSECEILINDTEIILLTRDNNKGIFLGRYDLNTFEVINVNKLQRSIASRPQIFKYNGDVYIMYNIDNTVYVDGYGYVARNTACLYKYKKGELIYIKEFKSLDGFHYYSVVNYKGKLLCVYSTDYKRLDASQTRSSLAYVELEI